MADCLKRIKQGPKEVAIVKLAERITNLQAPPSKWSKEKITAYPKEGQLIAKELKGHCQYSEERIADMLSEYKSYTE